MDEEKEKRCLFFLDGLYNMGILGFVPPDPWFLQVMEYMWYSGLITVQYRCYHELTNITFIMAITIAII